MLYLQRGVANPEKKKCEQGRQWYTVLMGQHSIDSPRNFPFLSDDMIYID